MSNSSLVSYTRWSPNHSGKRTHSIDRISPHCVVGQCSVETLGAIFAPRSREASCQYGIGADGRVGQYVSEANRSWCTSSKPNDQRAVTIECASNTYHPFWMNNNVWKTLIKLCVDICKRNGKTKLLWLGTKAKTEAYTPKKNEMVISVHRWYNTQKSCPGDWLFSRLDKLAKEVTKQLGGKADPEPAPSDNSYKVKVVVAKNDVLNVREKPNAKAKITAKLKNGEVYTIVEEKNGWGKLKSGVGWINLSYTKKV